MCNLENIHHHHQLTWNHMSQEEHCTQLIKFLLLLSSCCRQIPQHVVCCFNRFNLISRTSLFDGLFILSEAPSCFFLVEKKRSCFSEFLLGGNFLFRGNVGCGSEVLSI